MANKSYLLRLTLVATLGGLLFGYDTGVIAGTVGSLDAFFIEPKGLDELAASSLKGRLVSIALIGCICLLYTSPSPRDRIASRMPSSA